MAGESNQVVVAPRLIGEYVPSLTVLVDDKTKVIVPMTAADNLLLSQVRVAQLRELMDNQLTLLKGKTTKMKPMDIKSLVDSFAKIEDMGRFAYAPGLTEDEGGPKTGFQAAEKLARAVAEGVATAGHKAVANAKEDRQRKILELGKPKQVMEASVIEEVA